MYSTDTEEDANLLLTMTCPLVRQGEYLALELAREQTLGNLRAFSERLALADRFRKAKGRNKEKLRESFMAAQLAACGLEAVR